MTDIQPVDMLRSVSEVMQPDLRVSYFAVVEDGCSRPVTLADRHEAISRLTIAAHVPVSVRVHFETAKNLYLYSWFVYRFLAVAEQHALTTLEFALREAVQVSGLVSKKRADKLGLSDLLKRAQAGGLIKNEGLASRPEWALELARERYAANLMAEMIRAGTNEAVIDYSSVEVTSADLEFDWVGAFIKQLPERRNDYSHGSTTLRVAIFRTFEIVCGLINQMPHHEFPSQVDLTSSGKAA